MYSAMRSDISIAKMNTIMKNKAFDIRNPNKVRSLIGGFCHNLKAFHNPDGSGYRFLSDLIIKIDPQNPKLAENLLHALTRPKHFLNPRRSLIKKELRRILKTKDLSINLTELIEKALK